MSRRPGERAKQAWLQKHGMPTLSMLVWGAINSTSLMQRREVKQGEEDSNAGVSADSLCDYVS